MGPAMFLLYHKGRKFFQKPSPSFVRGLFTTDKQSSWHVSIAL
jgi:hypothetical protein